MPSISKNPGTAATPAAAPQGADPVSKALALGSYFLSGCLAINVSQVLGAPLALINTQWYNQWISFTKQQFAVLTVAMTQRWAPTVVRVSGDKSVRSQLFQTTDDDLLCLFPKRMVMIANHQIYTDWLYLWWIAYSNGMHGRIYIILKESLKRIPVIGWGMQLSQFIFLKRDWEQDRPQMATHLKKLDKVEDPMWLLLFPEGTNLAPSTREASAKWAAKNGIPDMKHTLLPRNTGLQFCLQELRQTIGYVYDCTLAYEGVRRGQYAQDVYTLQASYVNGKPPKCVHMYWRRFPISSIPILDDRRFELWLRTRWLEKDSLIEFWHKHGRFPADVGQEKDASGRIRRGAGYIESSIKAHRWNDFLHQFMPMGLLAMILYSFYGALPEMLQNSLKDHPMLKKIAQLPQVKVQNPGGSKALTNEPVLAAIAPGSQVKEAQAKAAQLAAAKTKKPTQPVLKHQPTKQEGSSTHEGAQPAKPKAQAGGTPKLRTGSVTPSVSCAVAGQKTGQERPNRSAASATGQPRPLKLSSKTPSVADSHASIASGTMPKLAPRTKSRAPSSAAPAPVATSKHATSPAASKAKAQG